jgi:hypothetical protein
MTAPEARVARCRAPVSLLFPAFVGAALWQLQRSSFTREARGDLPLPTPKRCRGDLLRSSYARGTLISVAYNPYSRLLTGRKK